MAGFYEWMSLKLEAARKKAVPHPLKPISVRHKEIQITPAPLVAGTKKRRRKKIRKPKPSPMVSTDVDRWLQSVAALSKDVEEFKKVQKKYQEKQLALAKKKEEETKQLAAKKPEVKAKPEVKKKIKKIVTKRIKKPVSFQEYCLLRDDMQN